MRPTESRLLNVGFSGYRLWPGPVAASEVLNTLEVTSIEEYSYASIARSILNHPGVRETHTKQPDWSYWAATWREGDRYLRLDFMPDEDHFRSEGTGHHFWSGCNIECDCLVLDLLAIWEAIRVGHPGVWLYEGESLLSPQAFLKTPEYPVE
jgi:hypothetical protein